MARVVIRKDFAEEIITRVNEKTESLLDTISTLSRKVTEAKNVYTSDNSSSTSIDAMSETINKIISSYSELNRKFSQALRANIDEYSKSDQKIASNLKAVASVPLAAGNITDSIIMTYTANSAANANAKNFLNEEQLSKAFFEKEGNYTFEYRNDGSVRINRDGEPLAFTSKQTADNFFDIYYGNEPKDNNSKTINAWNDGKNRKINKTYETFEENVAYEAGKAYTNKNNNKIYSLGVGAADNSDPAFQERIKEELSLSNNEDINMFTKGASDASINEATANEVSKNYKNRQTEQIYSVTAKNNVPKVPKKIAKFPK